MNNAKIKKLAKELCHKSGCHHKCPDTDKCIVEDEPELLINQNKSNNFEVKSNNELFKQALVEGMNRHIDKTIEEAKKIGQIEEMAKILCGMKNGCDGCMWSKEYCNERNYAEDLYNAGYRKQNVGEWIRIGQDSSKCSLCGKEHNGGMSIAYFCPNCGARMRGGAE